MQLGTIHFDFSCLLTFYNAFRSAIGGIEWFVLFYFLILILFFIIGKEYMNHGFVYPFLFLCLTVYNPFLIIPLSERIGLSARLRRLFWLMPVNITLGYASVWAISAPKKKFLRPLIAACIVLWCVSVGSTVFPYLQKPQNLYKVRSTIIEISELIEEDSQATGLSKNALYSSQQLLELRQYDPSITNILRRTDLLEWSIDPEDEKAIAKVIKSEHVMHTLGLVSRYGLEIEMKWFLKSLHRVNIHYIITDPGMDLNDYLSEAGFEKIGEISEFQIYHMVEDKYVTEYQGQ